jgi:hypothetical protein
MSTSFVPQINDCVALEKPTGKVSTLKEFLRSCVEFMRDETPLNALYEMIYHCTQGRETSISQMVVNQVLRRKMTNREF